MNSESPREEKGLVLVVDDDEAMRLLLRMTLEEGGFEVEEAVDGMDALCAFEHSRPSIVLLDVVMPGMNGFEVCSEIRGMVGGEHLPIVMVTGMEDIQSISRAYEVGATDFVTKPINWPILTQRLRYMMRASHALDDLRKSEAGLARAQRTARMGSWELHGDGGQLIFSSETRRICGFDETSPSTGYELLLRSVHPEDKSSVEEAIRRAVTRGIPSRLDYRIVLPDSTLRMVFQQVDVICSEERKTLQVIGTVQDITERKLAQFLELDRNKVLEMVIRSEALKDILLQLVHMMERQQPASIGAIFLVRNDRLYLGAAPRLPGTLFGLTNGIPIGPKSGCCGASVYLGQTIPVADISTSPLWSDHCHAAIQKGIRSSLSVPIISGKGKTLGAVSIFYEKAFQQERGDIQLLEMVGKLAAIAIEQRQLNERLAHQAHHDALTGLPNRLLVIDRLGQALAHSLRYGGYVAVIYIDLDRFKHVNDSLGHHLGDLLLKQVTERLTSCTRKSDTLARMGGDEFMLVVNGVADREDISSTGQRLLDLLETPFEVEGYELHISASIGISMFPDDGEDAAVLQRNADIAMYCAKNLGGNRYRFFTEEMNAVVVERLEIENELRKAMERKELELHYQPQYELSGERLRGVEALLRWNHPEIGRISPLKFIPVAEETGLIIPVGTWVLGEACRKNAEWQRAGFGPFKVAVNVSVVQLAQADFTDVVMAALEESGLSPQWLELEVTESTLIRDLKSVSKCLSDLRSLGVSIAIDDFGNGYSSMCYLQWLPVDCLKIDSSFIHELGEDESSAEKSHSLIKAFVTLAANLGLKVLAEGVESPEQYESLRELGCELGQGFLFNMPMCAKEFEALCQHDGSWPSYDLPSGTERSEKPSQKTAAS